MWSIRSKYYSQSKTRNTSESAYLGADILRTRLYHREWWHAEHIDYATHLILLVYPSEQRFTRMHLHQHTAQGPNIDFVVIRETKQHFRGAVEAALYIRVHFL